MQTELTPDEHKHQTKEYLAYIPGTYRHIVSVHTLGGYQRLPLVNPVIAIGTMVNDGSWVLSDA